MLYKVGKRTIEAISWLGHISNQIEQDQRYTDNVTLTELNTKNYQEAIHYIHLAMEVLNKQSQLLIEYQQKEEEEQEKKGNVISEKIN